MALRTWDWEVSPAGTTLTTGNTKATDNTSASSSGVNSGVTTIKSSSTAFIGGFSAEFYNEASSSSIQRLPLVAGNTQGAVSFFHRFDILPSGAGITWMHFRHAAGIAFRLAITSGNKLQLQNSTGGTIATSTASLVAAQWDRFEVVYTVATSTTGVITVNVYAGNGTSAYATISSSTADLGTAAITAVEIGSPVVVGSGLAAPVTQNFDYLRTNDGATAELGPISNQAPTVSVTSNQTVAGGATVNLSATAADTDGTIASYAWTFDYPTSGAPSLTGGTTANVSFTAGSAPQLYILRCTVTDNGGATAFATAEVRVPVSGATATRPISQNGSGVGTWVNTGGAGTGGQALADESDTTYVESPTVSGTEQTRRWRLFPSSARASGNVKLRLATDTGTANATVRLYEGTTLRQTWTQALTTTITDYTFTMSGATVSAITDWGNLSVELGVTS